MLYKFIEYQRSLLAPWSAWAAQATHAFADPGSPFAHVPGASCLAAGYDWLHRLGKTYGKPAFGVAAVDPVGRIVPVDEQVVLEGPFCRLLRFAHGPATAPGPRPAVLVCAPLAGHHAVLLREVVESLLPAHEVYVTDWSDARYVPLAEGAFHLDDYVGLIQSFIRHIGGQRLHVLAVCQATVPVLAAVSLLASAGEPTPRSLVLMGGPIDARRNPTAVDRLAARHPLAWFQSNLIYAVPDHYPGAGRRVYPSFLQHAGLMMAHPARIVGSQWDYYLDLLQGDAERAPVHRRACDEYNAVLDMAAEFYLDTIRVVFHQFRLARGNWSVQGQAVRPQDIRDTALLTVEGELDDISGRGQTQAAHDLCRGIAARRKRHVTVRQCGHYDLFSGPLWRSVVYPAVRDLFRQYA
ncbi:polyhydroxyalkanoate depolymerase [Cupriavidus basilensis]|uniref:Polyhydroxyalkanoate depolymerase n=1 Tax=Cupriavidus basilensis TaxID=68895 RepID=A0ABT6ANP8_9BURK|nr:polyhydroxyalkanoate depolymerase [Cupriavidus basilensis]MDF3834244.1 polyhydroxyalkanoate depolymerase [Cupriavidus basilensis]